MEAGRFGEPLEQTRIAPEICGRALDERRATQGLHASQVGQRAPEHRVGVVARGVDLAGADEIHHHMLVHQCEAELRGVDWPHDRVDLATRYGRLGRDRGAGGRGHGACRERPTRQ
jgi:hypothetical protein